MVTTLNEYKKNPKTGKYEKTGRVQILGKAPRKSGGGYETTVVATVDNTGKIVDQKAGSVITGYGGSNLAEAKLAEQYKAIQLQKEQQASQTVQPQANAPQPAPTQATKTPSTPQPFYAPGSTTPPPSQAIIQRALQEQQLNKPASTTPLNGRGSPGSVNNQPSGSVSNLQAGEVPGGQVQATPKKSWLQRTRESLRTRRENAEDKSPEQVGTFVGGYVLQLPSKAVNTGKGIVNIFNPNPDKNTIVQTYKAVKGTTTPTGVPGVNILNPVRTTDELVLQPVRDDPEGGSAQLTTDLASGKIIKTGLQAAKKIPVRTTSVTVEYVDEAGAAQQRTVRTLGLEQGTKAQPIVSFTPEGLQLGTPTPSTPIPPAQLKSIIYQPETALKGKVLQSQLDLTPAETQRIQSAVEISKTLGKEKGATVKDVYFNVEGLNQPKASSAIIEKFIAENEGVVFGSSTTQQLPPGYRTLKPGDIDLFFPGQDAISLTPKVKTLSEVLKKSGEQVEVSPQNPLIVQFSKTSSNAGNKLLEAKSGAGPIPVGEEVAPAGFLGIPFADLKKGQTPSTVPFGTEGARAITAGEQLTRKAAGATVISPGGPAEVPSFSGPGVLGKSQRALKDTAGLVQSAKGLIEIQKEGNILKRLKAAKASAEVEKLLSTYTPEQRQAIYTKLWETTGNRIPFSFEKTPTTSPQPKSVLFTSPSQPPASAATLRSRITITESPPTSPTQSPTTSPLTIPSRSPATSPSASSSPSPSPRYIPVKPSPSPRPRPSPSPRPPSPSPRPPSPSPVIPPSPPPPSPPTPSPSPPPRPPSPSPVIPPSPPSPSPPPPSPPTPRILTLPKSSKQERGFYALVRKKGIFERVNLNPLSKADAFALGATTVANSAAASFKVIQAEAPIQGAFKRRPANLNDLYQSKKESGVFIERRSRRIKSTGELREITFKGLQAQSGRSYIKKIFGR